MLTKSDRNNARYLIVIGLRAEFSDGTTSSALITVLSEDGFKDPKFLENKNTFEGPIDFVRLETDLVVARTYGGDAKIDGDFFHIRNFPDRGTTRVRLFLKDEFNSCEYSASGKILAGARVAVGKIRGGHETQILLHSEDSEMKKITVTNKIEETYE